MIDTLPLFLRKSYTYNEIFNAKDKQFQILHSNINDISKQMNVDTATWGLDIFEKELKIPIEQTKPIEERRSVIKSKMRGTGKVDSILIKIVADAFTNGDVLISFDGKINIQFTSVLGIPPNILDLENALRDIIPAHLDINFIFIFLTWNQLDQANVHWSELDDFNATWNEFEVYQFDGSQYLALNRFTHQQLSQYTHADFNRRRI